jgi:hypothetical protein
MMGSDIPLHVEVKTMYCKNESSSEVLSILKEEYTTPLQTY